MILLLAASLAAHAQVPVSSPQPGKAVAQERKGGSLGLGLAVGAPSGLTGKMWLGDWSSLQASFGGDLGRYGDLVATADYVIELRPFSTESDDYSVPLHVGAGFNLSTNPYEGGAVLMGPRAVFGLSVLVRELPVDLFIEMAPTFYFYEDLTWSVDGQFGTRYYF